MKQLIPIFLFFLPCLAWAQYPSNGNQKITLGEQTTADGLIWRGVAADTTTTVKSDTAAYFVLDTVNKKLYFYKVSAIPKWNEISGSGGGGAGTVTSITGGTGLTGGTITTSGTLAADTSFLFTQSDTLGLNLTSRFATKLNISDTASMLTPYFRDADTSFLNLTSRFAAKQNTLTLTTTGTSGASTLINSTLNIPQYSGGGGVDSTAIKYVNTYGTQTVNGAKTFTSTITGARFDPTSSSVSGTGMYLPSSGKLGFSVSGAQKLNLVSNGIGFATDLFNWISAISFTLDFPQFAISSGASGGALISSNFYINQSNERIYKTTNGASFINTQGGTIGFSTAPSGTINTVATFNPVSLYIASNGNVGIVNESPSEKLHVDGNARFTGVTAGTFSNNLNITSTGVLTTATSDAKYKYNIRPLNYGLETLLQLNPVNFQWIEGEEEDLGFIAQDVAEIIPEAVNTNWNSDLLFRYESLIPILTKAIQEQQALIKALEQRIINLENK